MRGVKKVRLFNNFKGLKNAEEGGLYEEIWRCFTEYHSSGQPATNLYTRTLSRQFLALSQLPMYVSVRPTVSGRGGTGYLIAQGGGAGRLHIWSSAMQSSRLSPYEWWDWGFPGCRRERVVTYWVRTELYLPKSAMAM